MIQHDNEDDAWLQYGGPERNYQAVDMGPCLLLELILLPLGLEVPSISQEMAHWQETTKDHSSSGTVTMMVESSGWDHHHLFWQLQSASADQVEMGHANDKMQQHITTTTNTLSRSVGDWGSETKFRTSVG